METESNLLADDGMEQTDGSNWSAPTRPAMTTGDQGKFLSLVVYTLLNVGLLIMTWYYVSGWVFAFLLLLWVQLMLTQMVLGLVIAGLDARFAAVSGWLLVLRDANDENNRNVHKIGQWINRVTKKDVSSTIH